MSSDRQSKRWSMPSLQPLEGFDEDNEYAGDISKPERPAFQQQNSGGRSKRNSMSGNTGNKRASISGTAFGKSDFGVPLSFDSNNNRKSSMADRRASRRISRISKLSDVSEADSDRTRSRILTMISINSDGDMVTNVRASRRISLNVVDQLAADAAERRASRRLSSNSIVNGSRMSYMNRTLDWQQNPETLQKNVAWDEDLKKPSNWNHQKKLVNTMVASILAFCYTTAISVYAAAPSDQVGHLSSSQAVCAIPFAAYVLGFALGPALATPFERAYGRKLVLFLSLPLYVLCMIGASVSKTIAALTVLRLLAATFAAPGLWITYTVISEVWIGTCETIAVAFYTLCLGLGYVAGPIVGGVVLQYINWHWTEWIGVILIVPLLMTTVAMSETHEDTIKRKDKTSSEVAQEIREKGTVGRRSRSSPSRLIFAGNLMFSEPMKMLFAQKSLLLVTLYLSSIVAIMVTLPLLSLPAFGKAYAFDSQSRGLTFAAVAAGLAVSFIIIAIMDRYVHQPRVMRWESELDGDAEKPAYAPDNSGLAHRSWRKGVAVSTTRNLGLRMSMASTTTTDSSVLQRSNSDASSHSTSRREKRRSRHAAFSERNINIAIAVTRFLNAVPANAEHKIIVERVMVLLKNTVSFTEICTALSALGLTFEEALLAKVIVSAVKAEKASSDLALARSKSLHRLAAQAALMGSEGDEVPESPVEEMPLHSAPEILDAAPIGPPPEWRFLPALPGSILLPAGLLLFAWTLREGTAWFVPCVGLAVAGAGAGLGLSAGYAWLLELQWDQIAAANARAPVTIIGSVLAAVASVVGVALVDALGLGAGVSVFAGLAAVAGVVPWVVAFRKRE